MRTSDLFTDAAKSRIRDAIVAVEKCTAAEVVVTVRRQADKYPAADWRAGALFGLAALCVVLFHPAPFAVWSIPVDVAMAFGLGLGLSKTTGVFKRVLTLPGTRAEAVRLAANDAFVEQGISRTRGRNGILIFVSAFERSVVVVPDAGIDEEMLGDAWMQAKRAAIAAPFAAGSNVESWAKSIEAWGPVLGEAMPRHDDDENELPDEVAGA